MERTDRNLTHLTMKSFQITVDANLRMRAMLFQHQNMVNTAFSDFPVMRIDRICDFVPKCSVRTAAMRRRLRRLMARIAAQKFTSHQAGEQS